MECITVGKAAEIVGVSTRTIRLWEARGLVPEAERTPAGYRLFTDADLARLQFIRRAKSLGLTLSEIREVFDLQRAGTTPCERVSRLIDGHIAQIDRALDDLWELRQMLTAARSAASNAPQGKTDTIVCHIIESANLN